MMARGYVQLAEPNHGAITQAQMRLGESGEPLNFDIIRVPCSKQVPSNSQPEIFDKPVFSPWELKARPSPPEFQ
jgi:hypothetical protein